MESLERDGEDGRAAAGQPWLQVQGARYCLNGYLDLDSGRFEQVAFCPAYLRGLSFVGEEQSL